jgi:pyridoxal 5'-phosphate synthase pdxS subunit
MATAIVKAVTHFNDPEALAEASRGLTSTMRGQSVAQMPVEQQLAGRGN